ncbi:MAG: Membrane protein insertase YidC [Pedosphaera sp.]|nr:Membrane protein insertase YidC [Pedosphaera sp.]
MDRKSIAILVACSALLFLWPVLVNKISPPPPAPPPSTNVVSSATNQLAGDTNQPATIGPIPGGTGSNSSATFVVHTNIPEQLLTITNDKAIYTFTSRGGGLQKVELTRYPEKVSTRREKIRQTNELATLNTPIAPPVMAVLGGEALQEDGVFKLTQSNNVVRAEKTLSNGLALVKDFQLGTNYLVNTTVRLENRSKQPISLPPQEWFIGTATPMGPLDNELAVGALWFNGSGTEPVNVGYFDTNTTTFFGLFHRTPKTEYRAGSNNVAWAAVQNQFFTLVAMPKTPAPGVVARGLALPPPSREELRENPKANLKPKAVETALTYPAMTLAPGQSFEQQFNLFAGPKEYRTLANIGDKFNNELDLIMGFGWFAPVSKGLLAAMNWLHHKLLLPYGWAIVAITVFIKLLFWPLTQYSTKSMKRMQALQPQIKALQEKYKDEPQKLTQKQMEFWKKNKVNPLSGCLPMLLQIPVFFGFYRMLQSAIELRGAPFLWIGDLSKPDTIFFIPGLDFPVNPMPLIMGATMLWQTSMTPPSPGMDPSQQKIMRYMPLMMLFFLYNFSSGLALYWTVQNLLTVLQTKLTKTQDASAAAKTPTPVAPQKKHK